MNKSIPFAVGDAALLEKVPLLLVDDRPDNLLVLDNLLDHDSYAMTFAYSGQEALRACLKTDFALVLLDAQMPGMDGFEVAELMRANPRTRHVPIIFVTAGMRETDHLFHGYEAGAVDYLVKPIEPLVLRGKVGVFAELYRQRREIQRHRSILQATVQQRTNELRETARQLEVSLHEKEVLLKEIYHRVKNNLQVISSLLNMQAREAGDKSPQALLLESANRVKSMALVHEQLYQAGDLSRVRYDQYAAELVRHLMLTHEPRSHEIPVRVAVAPVRVGIETAIPLGLIINELISNSYKHAFPGETGGEIRLSLEALPSRRLRLTVRDDGCGLPADFDMARTTSLGLRLVRTLADQVEGELSVGNDGGAVFSIVFSLSPAGEAAEASESPAAAEFSA